VGNDGLQPGRAALVGAGDDNVVIAKRDLIPATAIEVVIVNAADALRISAHLKRGRAKVEKNLGRLNS
jgi:hypothetical protein